MSEAYSERERERERERKREREEAKESVIVATSIDVFHSFFLAAELVRRITGRTTAIRRFFTFRAPVGMCLSSTSPNSACPHIAFPVRVQEVTFGCDESPSVRVCVCVCVFLFIFVVFVVLLFYGWFLIFSYTSI